MVKRSIHSPARRWRPPDIAAALKFRENSLKIIFDNIADVVYLLDVEADGYRFVAVNRSFLEATGLEEKQVVGRRVDEVIPEPSLGGVLGHYAQALGSGAPVFWEEESKYPAGTKYGEVMVAPVKDAGGRCKQLVGTVHDVTDRRAAEERLHRLAHHDGLTGLPNRRQLYKCLEKEIRSAGEHGGRPVALLYLDLDRFKHVNDTLGHAIGDELLRRVAERLLSCTRLRDTVGRLGGDEFGIVAPLAQKPEDAAALARKVIDEFKRPLALDAHEVLVTPSIGITVCPDDACEPEAMMNFADTAMYHAKAAGRNTWRFYTPRMNEWARRRRELEASLRQAIGRNEFVLHYQPQIDIGSGRWTGAEALLRWKRPGHRLWSPDRFVPVLEESGLIVEVGRWVIEAACRQLGEWRHEGMEAVSISVNVSARQVMPHYRDDLEHVEHPGHAQPDDLCEHVARCMGMYDVAPGSLELELTETALMAHADRTVALLDRLKQLGVRILVDDFGTGYSSLAYLKRFPIDSLKIDKDFVRDLSTNGEDRAITRAIISLAHTLNLKVIAEGVESAQQLEILRREHCDEAQGFYFSQPVPPRQLARLFRASGAARGSIPH